jgi:hypothetical protein
MLHLRPIPPRAKRCDVRVRNAKLRETTNRLREEVWGSLGAAPTTMVEQEPAEQPWHTYNND